MTKLKFITISKEFMKEHLSVFKEISSDLLHDNWDASNYLSDYNAKWQYSIACYSDNELEGYIIASEKNTRHAHIHKFVVKKESRSKGIGKMLLTKFIERIRYSADILTLKVYNDNPEAIKFYYANGFILKGNNGSILLMERLL